MMESDAENKHQKASCTRSQEKSNKENEALRERSISLTDSSVKVLVEVKAARGSRNFVGTKPAAPSTTPERTH